MHDLVRAVDQHEAAVLALSVVYTRTDSRLVDELLELRRLCPGDCAIIIGGAAAGWYADQVCHSGIEWLDGLADLRNRLATLQLG